MSGIVSRFLSHAHRHGARLDLRVRLVLFGTLLAAVVILAAFVGASLQVRANTRRLLARELSESQRVALEQNAGFRSQLLRTAGLVTNNSTLRAALETYRLEMREGAGSRPDLVATIQHEVTKIAAALGQDLLVVTDDEGRILSASERGGLSVIPGEELASQPVVDFALNQDAPVGERNFAVLRLGGIHFQVACVPIILQGYIIGTLTQGDRLEETFVTRMRDLLGGEIVVTIDDLPIVSTLDAREPAPGADDAMGELLAIDAGGPQTVWIQGEEYVAASVPLGLDAAARPVVLHLLHPLSSRLQEANSSLFLVFLTCGLAAVALAGLLAISVSRSILRPLQEFVGFMRSVAASGDPSRRFSGRPGSPEVATLNDAHNQMMDSLDRTRAQLTGAREDLVKLDRLKEAEKMAALGRMVSGAAHEINNPLSAVIGNIELLIAREPLGDYGRQRLDCALREGRRVAGLVRNLLKLSRRSDESRRAVDLNQAIRESLSVCRHDFAAAGMTITEDLAGEELAVLGNELELQQIFLNLFRNAYDAMQEQGKGGSLVIRSRRQGREVVASVADSGPGLRSKDRLFEPFFTTKEIGKGTGLGLSICLGIAESHGGSLRAENRPEGGAAFTLRLPAHTAARQASIAAPAAASKAPARASQGASGASVLVVEDEPSVLELEQDLLESMGARVTTARTGAQAIRILESRSFDLVITDLRMPGGVSGQDLYRWIERNRPAVLSRVVFVTGDTMGEESQAFLSGLANRCLVKPFAVEEYTSLVKEVLDEAALPA